MSCTDCPRRYDPTPHTYQGTQQDILVVGEAPGYQEYQRGEPFVGQSGRLLRRAFEYYHIPLDRVAFTNLVSCWPGPGNPKPTARVISSCAAYNLEPLIALAQPRIILAVGSLAIKYFTGKILSVMAYQSTEIERDHHLIRIFSVVHPAAVLRYPATYRVMFLAQIKYVAQYLTDMVQSQIPTALFKLDGK